MHRSLGAFTLTGSTMHKALFSDTRTPRRVFAGLENTSKSGFLLLKSPVWIYQLRFRMSQNHYNRLEEVKGSFKTDDTLKSF